MFLNLLSPPNGPCAQNELSEQYAILLLSLQQNEKLDYVPIEDARLKR